MRELPLCLAQNTQPDLAIFDVWLATRKLGPELGPKTSSILSVQARELAADRRRGRKRADGVGVWSKEGRRIDGEMNGSGRAWA
jgi:hypothetical protein